MESRIQTFFGDRLNNVVFYAVFGGVNLTLAYKNIFNISEDPAFIFFAIAEAALSGYCFYRLKHFVNLVRANQK